MYTTGYVENKLQMQFLASDLLVLLHSSIHLFVIFPFCSLKFIFLFTRFYLFVLNRENIGIRPIYSKIHMHLYSYTHTPTHTDVYVVQCCYYYKWLLLLYYGSPCHHTHIHTHTTHTYTHARHTYYRTEFIWHERT